MSSLDAKVWIFDPVLPFKKVASSSPGIDTWHDDVLISKELRTKLPHVRDAGRRTLRISGGVTMSVQSVEIGLQVGPIQIPSIRALVVDGGFHDCLLGSNIFDYVFRRSQTTSDQEERDTDRPSGERSRYSSAGGDHVRYSSAEKEDPSSLSIEIYPVKTPFPMRHLEHVLQNQRIIYNVSLIAINAVQVEGLSENEIDQVIDMDAGIPPELALQISCIDSGSIWLSLKSGSQSALKYLGSLFQKGASAKLSEQLANSKKAETEAQISAATRDEVAAQLISEQHKLRADNIHATYETWRNELRSQLSFLDELIQHTSDKDVIEQLKNRKDQAILQMAEQQMVPIVRNVPGSFVSLGNDKPQLQLPPPKE